MITCARCGRLYPEVVGAPSQVCPHCGLEMDAAAPAAYDAPVAADPLGAAALAARFLGRHYGTLLLLALPVLAIDLVASFLVQAYAVAQGIDAQPEVLTTGQEMQFLGVALPLLLLVAGSAWFAYWAIPMAALRDGRAWGPRLRSLAARWPQILLVGFVLTLLYVAGLIMLVVTFFVFAHWFLYVPAALAEGETTLGGAFEASRRFARARRTHGFTALVLLVWGATAAIVFTVDAALAPKLGVLGPAVWPVATWLLLPIVPALPAAFWSMASVPSAPAPAGALAPEARSRSTSCPHCGELIRYEPRADGSAADVVCPSCGKSGRVL